MNIITEIQTRLKAPKSQDNKFGKYKYRSCEDIVESIKPLLAEFDVFINLSDEMIMLGDRFYIKATAKIISSEKGLLSESTGWARESFQRKGMDDSQITGTASSYARKYALNGLLAIDDTKDADTQDNRGYEPISPEPINQEHVDYAVSNYREIINADVIEVDFKLMQAIDRRLSNDERISVMGAFGNEKHSGGRLYRTLIADYLKMKPADLVNTDDFQAPIDGKS